MHVGWEKNVAYGLFIKMEGKLCISNHCSKRNINWHIPHFHNLIDFFSLRLTASAFIYSPSTSNILVHYLKVNITRLFLFSLHYSNDIFSHQSSLLWWKVRFDIRVYFRSYERAKSDEDFSYSLKDVIEQHEGNFYYCVV